MLWDMKLIPAKENAEAIEVFEVEFDMGGPVEDKEERLVVEALWDGCLLDTDSCKLFARAFSCWRMKFARLYIERLNVSTLVNEVRRTASYQTIPEGERLVCSFVLAHSYKQLSIFSLQTFHLGSIIQWATDGRCSEASGTWSGQLRGWENCEDVQGCVFHASASFPPTCRYTAYTFTFGAGHGDSRRCESVPQPTLRQFLCPGF